MPARYRRNNRALFKRFRNDRRPHILWPSPPATSFGDNLHPTDRVGALLRLAHRNMTRRSASTILNQPLHCR